MELTDPGLTLQLPLPETSEQLRLMVPLNPLLAVTLIGPLVAVLPTLTAGKEPVSDKAKSATALRMCNSAAARWVV
jgi:hypothetical protein